MPSLIFFLELFISKFWSEIYFSRLYSGPEDDVTVRIESKRMYQTFEEMLTTEGLDKCLPGIKTVDHGIKVLKLYN